MSHPPFELSVGPVRIVGTVENPPQGDDFLRMIPARRTVRINFGNGAGDVEMEASAARSIGLALQAVAACALHSSVKG